MHALVSGEYQEAFLDRMQPCLENDERIHAAWFEGSLGRGDHDRYSDIDLHILVGMADVEAFRAKSEGWLNGIRPLVLYRLLFDGQMINALTVDCLRIDIWIHEGESVERDSAKIAVVHDPAAKIKLIEGGSTLPEDRSQVLDGMIREFWRCIALAPSVVGRNELIVASIGLGRVMKMLTDIQVDGYGCHAMPV